MMVQLRVNGVDFTQWIAENGLTFSPVERIKRSVITMDGTDHRASINKQQLDIQFMDMPDSELGLVENALSLANPALVDYTDKSGIEHTGVPFYFTGVSAGAKRVIGKTTYWTDLSLSLEEK